MSIRAVRKGDGHPHLTFKGAALCGRTLTPNRWAKIRRFGTDQAARMVVATIQRPRALSAVCATCMRKAGY